MCCIIIAVEKQLEFSGKYTFKDSGINLSNHKKLLRDFVQILFLYIDWVRLEYIICIYISQIFGLWNNSKLQSTSWIKCNW